ncbi:cell division protein [Undibacterium sp. Di26W]|uniref:cell division protein n=1 Tax=Undibacterium sp. Di26W TaxID=3413035 RepID=UPI003BF0BDE1
MTDQPAQVATEAHFARTEKIRTWLIRWMMAAAVAHFVAGAILPWLARQSWMDVYHQHIDQHFWQAAAPDAARAMQIWWISLFGPTVQTVGLWMAALTQLGNRYRSRLAWGWLLAGIVVWAPQDILISLQANATVHVWIDSLAVLTLIPPLLWLWRIDQT